MAEEHPTATERERQAHEETTESRGAQAAAEQVQALKAQLQQVQAVHFAAEAQWEAQRVAGAVSTASALDEASRWKAEAARWKAEALHWEAEAQDQAEQLKVLQHQHEQEIDSLLDEFCDTEDGYRKVIEKQRKARHRAERQTEAAETALDAVREVAEAELSKIPGSPAHAEDALGAVRVLAEQQDVNHASSIMGTIEQSLPAHTQFEGGDGNDATSRPHAMGVATPLQLLGPIGLGAVPTVASPTPHSGLRVGGTEHIEPRLRKVCLIRTNLASSDALSSALPLVDL